MSTIQCFWIDETGQAELWFRRCDVHGTKGTCPANNQGHHNAYQFFEIRPVTKTAEGYIDWIEPPKDNPNWPKTCACGYTFQDDDYWYVDQRQIYTRPDTKESFTLDNAPVGAMWDSWWLAAAGWKGSDGKCITVKIPGNCNWSIDAASTDGKPWDRTGTPPNITARPSILLKGQYHGFLTNGVLTSC